MEGKKMYTLEVREDTIRIPAEYIREGQSLSQHVDRLAHQAFEGRFDDDDNFVIVTYDREMIGRGRIIHGDGAIYLRPAVVRRHTSGAQDQRQTTKRVADGSRAGSITARPSG